MKLSEHFTLAELVRTSTSLPNVPDQAAIDSLTHLCVAVLEPLRALWGDRPIRVNSGFRSAAVNQAIGGAKGSQHQRGEAADIVPAINAETAMAMLAAEVHADRLDVDQAIIYASGFIHVSYRVGANRRQLLRSAAAYSAWTGPR